MSRRYRARTTAVARGTAALVAGLVLLGGVAVPADAAADDAGERARQRLADQMDAAGVPGAAVVVVDVDGATAAHGLGSTGDGRQVTPRPRSSSAQPPRASRRWR
jgi:hypothetical protein